MSEYDISWDYEESTVNYYHIIVVNGPLEGLLEDIAIGIPRTPENDSSVAAIVMILQDIAARLQEPEQ